MRYLGLLGGDLGERQGEVCLDTSVEVIGETLAEDLGKQYIRSVSYTVCPGSSDPFYIVTYYIKWVTTSWTYSITAYKS